MKTKRCSRCKQFKSVDDFGICNSNPDGRKYACRECLNEAMKAYRQTEKGKRVVAQWRHSKNGRRGKRRVGARYKKRYPEKIKAGTRVRDAVRDGILPHPSAVQCKLCAKRAKHYHHEDYSRPLDVTPLCIKCHNDVHRGKIVLFGD